MKKLITIALLCAMLLSCLASCGMQKGEINIADEANVQNVVNVPAIPTENVSKWTGGEITNVVDVTLDATTGKASSSFEGIDLSWFDPKSKNHELLDAADLVGFLKLRLVTTTAAFKDNYKAYTGEDLNAFAGHTFTLKANVDLNGVNVQNYHSNYIFAGTFDGDGNAIFNFKMDGINSGNKGFFSQLTGEACLRNLSLLECTAVVSGQADKATKQSDGTYKLTNNSKSVYGIAVGVVATEEGKTITIQNVYTSGVVQNGTNTKYDVFTKVSGVVGQIQGDGAAVVDGCASSCTLDLDGTGSNIELAKDKKSHSTKTSYYGQYTGGIVSYVGGSANVTISNCSFGGKILSANASVAGILAESATTGTLEITDCSVSGDITGSGNSVAGVIGKVSKDCPKVAIEDCTVNSTIKGDKLSGGVIGYLSGTVDQLTLKNVKVDGSFSGDRSSAGAIGYVSCGDAILENVVVNAAMDFNLTDVKNQNAGGLVGRIDYCKTLTFKDCVVAGDINVNYNSEAEAEDGIATTYVGGLLGYCKAVSTKIQIKNCQVGTSEKAVYMELTKTNKNVDAYAGVYVGGATVNAEGKHCTVSQVNVSNHVVPTVDDGIGFDVAGPNTLEPFALRVVGYQTRDNGNGTYDLRYAIAAQDIFDGLGVRASIRYVDKNGVFDEMNQKIYVDTVYSYLMGMDENDDYFYAAEDYYYDYLYTLVIKGIPEEYTFEDNNLQVIVRPFGATNENGVVTEKGIGYIDQGKYLSNTSAKDAGITVDNFSKTLDEKFTAEDVVYIPGGSYDTSISEGINTHRPEDAEVAGAYKEGTVEKPTHYYLDVNKSLYADYALLNITYNFKVAESGWYDMCIDMRMKGSGTDFNGSNKRETLMLVDWVGGERAYDISFELDSVLDVRNDSAGSYMSGLKIWLEAGEHTLTFTADPSFGDSYYHIRGIYLVQAD